MAKFTETDGDKRWQYVKQLGADNEPVDLSYSSTARLVSAAGTTNATVVKATPGRLFAARGFNANAAARYLKFYNKATTPSEVDVPLLTLYLAPLLPFEFLWNGVSFSAGISYRLVTGVADNDTGAVTAADILALNIEYN